MKKMTVSQFQRRKTYAEEMDRHRSSRDAAFLVYVSSGRGAAAQEPHRIGERRGHGKE